jgi:hypothetical protein
VIIGIMKKIFCFFICAIIGFSCTVQKRSYKKGFYVDWASRQKKTEKKETPLLVSHKPIMLKQRTISLAPFDTEKEHELIKSETPSSFKKNEKTHFKKKGFSPNDEPCGDVITFKDGDEATVKIIEVSENVIKYKRCDNLDGPLVTASKASVFSIRYANGTKELVRPGETSSSAKSSQPIPSTRHSSLNAISSASFAFGILGIVFFVFGILFSFPGLLMANAIIKDIKSDPNSGGDLSLAKAARIMCIVAVAMWVFLASLLILVIVLA